MTRNEYLKLCILANKHYKKKWIVSILNITKGGTRVPEELDLINETWGYSFIHEGEKVKIEDSKANEPLFNILDRVQIDNTWLTSIDKPLDVPLGNLLFNAMCLYPAFGNSYPFATGKLSIGDIESSIAPRLRDTPEEGKKRPEGFLYCDEFNKFQNSLEYFTSLASFLNQSATVKTITKSPEFEAYRKKLAAEYGDQLNDPVKLVEYERKLQAYDNEWLKGDPADGTFLVGKLKNVARKKMHISVGIEPGVDKKEPPVPILSSLDDGWDTRPEAFTSSINGIRHGSLSRGKETVKGGVTAKYLLRAGNNFAVKNEDCGAKNGVKYTYTPDSIGRLAGRYIIHSTGEAVHIDSKEEANKYINKLVKVRSPAYCRNEGDSICRTCAGDSIALNPNGVSIALTEMSAVVLNDFMKAMHDTSIKTERLDINDLFS